MLFKKFGFLFPVAIVVVAVYLASSYKHDARQETPVSKPVTQKIQFKSDVSGSGGMVSTASQYATQVGVDILKNGGNAIDAAVAIGFALAVTYPQAGNIGGGGFMVIRTKDTIISVDYREKAPAASTRNMFLDPSGNFVPEKSQIGHLSCGVPGSVAGLLYALDKYGTMSRDAVIDPAISLAENGFSVESRFAESLNSNAETFKKYESTRKIFTKDGSSYYEGEIFRQIELSNTLKAIKISGRDGFYSGINADLLEQEMLRGAGLITKKDLLDYQPVERRVVHTNYKGYDVYSMAPPSSGGIALIQLLNMIEHESLPDTSWKFFANLYRANYIHVAAECMKMVYADRSEYLGDPDFWKVPASELISKKYALHRWKQVTNKAILPEDIKPGLTEFREESKETTHYSVIDKDGNMVSVTTTLNNTYGSYVVVDGAGFLLNDEMDDFASKPGEPNMFGLIGSDANAIEPGKRMLSSMTPTIILKDGKPFMILGSPGGGKIITTVFQVILNVIDFGFPLNEAVDLPRYHHQWQPDFIQYEKGAILNDEVFNNLISIGYTLKEVPEFGRVDAILIDWDKHMYYGHSDRRGYGLALGF